MTTDLPSPRHEPLPIEAIARYPLPGMLQPGAVQWSPDDRLITFLWSPDRTLTRQLFACDPATGERHLLLAPSAGGTTDANVSLEEALRRERQRQREEGVTSYSWAEHAFRLLVPLQGAIHVQDGPDAPLRRLVDAAGGSCIDPQISPDGRWVAYVQDDELFVVPADGGKPRQLTSGARGTGKTNGLAEYVAQEEMGRAHGFWWSPNSGRLAFVEVDETHLPVYRIVHQGKDSVGEGAQEDHRYPFAGGDNARVRLGVIPVEGGEPIWLDLRDAEYLARVDWLPDGSLCAQLQNREQSELELVRWNLPDGTRSMLLRERSEVWINLHDMFRPVALEDGPGFVWASERSGYRHLYLYRQDGTLVRHLTDGPWQMDALAGIDEAEGVAYFTASLPTPTESQLFAVGFDGGEPRRISREPGMHAVVLDHAKQRYVDTHQSLDAPPTVTLRSLRDGALLATLYDDADPRVAELPLQRPELVSLPNRHGTQLWGALFRPPARFGDGPYPTIVQVYGGPHVQQVTNGWSTVVQMRAQYLASLGFLVFVLDNRGSARRGLQFEGAIKHHMGDAEVEDQVDGVRWLAAQGLADPERVGIYGWSYGGYMALMCLARAPETFAAAVAGAPVTSWDGYDTHYTERYMGTPRSNPAGYAASAVMPYVKQIRGRLLLIHGLIDENVHFRHTARLINALIAARTPYELQLFPNERHMPRSLADRVFMEERIRDFFVAALCPDPALTT